MDIVEKTTKTLSKNISLLRRQKGMTQLELADKLSYSDKAISKWERGEAIPDVIVLIKISELFGVSLNDLVQKDLSEEINEKEIMKTSKKRSLLNKCLIALMSSGLVWLIAVIIFVIVEFALPYKTPSYLTFIYAIPAFFIVLLVFSMIWRFHILNFIFVSALTWTLFTSVFLTMNIYLDMSNLWLLFIIPAAFQVLVVFWFLRGRANKRKKIEQAD